MAGAAASGPRWSEFGSIPAFVVALVLIVAVAVLDYLTGYELRFAVLYFAPIALVTWTGGWRQGIAIVVISGLCWFVSFRSVHVYSQDIFFYWDGVVMLATFMAFVFLLERLRIALARADERFLRVLEELHAAVYVVDPQSGSILYANRRLARVMNSDPFVASAAELEKRFSKSNHPADADGGQQAQVGSNQAGFRSEEVWDQASGRWYLVQAGPIPWKHNRRVILKVITDISEQRHAQMLKRQHQDMLHQTARPAALAEIASYLAHEINQPLMAIASYNDACLRLLAGTPVDTDEVIAALEKSRGQAVRAGQIIARVRDFLRSRHPQPTRCDLNAIVRESLELMEIQLEDSGIKAELALANWLPKLQADRLLLIQVVVNLVQNAIDAMRSVAPHRCRLSISTHSDADGAIAVSVGDQGEGVSDAVKDWLYKPFFTTKPQGLGLGLSICRSVVEAHGGRLWHSSNAGEGCTFHFAIPPQVE